MWLGHTTLAASTVLSALVSTSDNFDAPHCQTGRWPGTPSASGVSEVDSHKITRDVCTKCYSGIYRGDKMPLVRETEGRIMLARAA